jgi:hypothetical protein
MNGKDILKIAAAIAAGVTAGVTVFANKKDSSEDDKRPLCCGTGYATYGMAIDAVTKSKMSSYWKACAMQDIPKDCSDPGLYAAVISIMSDDSMSGYWKCSAIEDLFR